MSLSESFERELRILCFSSTIAKCVDSDDDVDDDCNDDDDCAVAAVVVVVEMGFVGFEDLGP